MNHKFNLKDRVVFNRQPATVIEVRLCEAGIYYVIKLNDKPQFVAAEHDLSKPFTIRDFIAAADNAKASNETYVYTIGDRNYTYQRIQGLLHMTVCDPRRTILYLTIADFIYHHEQDFV
jgi:hypothetical protein